MVVTYEEKVDRLKQADNWWTFTDSQRVFLDGMAQGMQPLEAIKKAYPDCKNGVTLTKHMLSRVGIQKALELIDIDVKQANVSKSEALGMLSRQLRKATEPDVVVKLLALYSKLAGWNKEDEPEDPLANETNLDKLVAAMEKKRKKG